MCSSLHGVFAFLEIVSALSEHLPQRLTVKVMVMQKRSAELKAASTVLIIGGGAVGVELAGKLPHLSVHVYLPACLSVCLSVFLSVCLSVYLLLVCPCACQFACPHPTAFLPLLICLTCPHSDWLSLLVVPVLHISGVLGLAPCKSRVSM